MEDENTFELFQNTNRYKGGCWLKLKLESRRQTRALSSSSVQEIHSKLYGWRVLHSVSSNCWTLVCQIFETQYSSLSPCNFRSSRRSCLQCRFLTCRLTTVSHAPAQQILQLLYRFNSKKSELTCMHSAVDARRERQ